MIARDAPRAKLSGAERGAGADGSDLALADRVAAETYPGRRKDRRMLERVFILKRTDVFRDLPNEVLESLAPHLEDVELEAGDPLFAKGDLGTAMFIVVEGRMRVHDGERTIATLEGGAVLGEISVLSAEERNASVTAETDAHLLRLDQDVLYEVMALAPAVSRGFIGVLLDRLG